MSFFALRNWFLKLEPNHLVNYACVFPEDNAIILSDPLDIITFHIINDLNVRPSVVKLYGLVAAQHVNIPEGINTNPVNSPYTIRA